MNFHVEIISGVVEIDSRFVFTSNGLQGQSRKRNVANGNIGSWSEWENSGVSMIVKPFKPVKKQWWCCLRDWRFGFVR